MILQSGYPAVASFTGTLGYSLVKTTPVTPLVLRAGIPALAEFKATLGVSLELVSVAVPRPIDVQLSRKRASLTLASRSLDVELSRRILRTEISK